MSPLNSLMEILALREAAAGQSGAASRAMAPYKRGGSPRGGLRALSPRQPQPVTPGGTSEIVQGPGGGQDDVVPAALAPGEYVWDADTVSAFGDGDSKEGARRLDAVRQAIRAHKRSAPASKIPPKAKPFSAYTQGIK